MLGFTFIRCIQPVMLTQVLEYSNLLFTVLFGVEMALKLVADGLVGYIRDGFNVFDGFIVILRYGRHTTPTRSSAFNAETIRVYDRI